MTHTECAYIQVIDPANRTGKVQIPFDVTCDTVGRAEWLNGEGETKKDVSLCMLYQQRRCNAGHKCNQIHAEKAFIAKLRQEADLQNTRCCPYHDGKEGLSTTKVIKLQTQNGAVHEVHQNLLSRTTTLDMLLAKKDSVVVISTTRICRLQQRNCCKYGKDCKNVHLCREAGRQLSQNQRPTVIPRPLTVVPTLPLAKQVHQVPAQQTPSIPKRNGKRRMSKDTQNPTTPPNERLDEFAGMPIPASDFSLKNFQAAFSNKAGMEDMPVNLVNNKPVWTGQSTRSRNAKKGKREAFVAENSIKLSSSCGSDMFGDSFAKICLPRDLLSPI
eukprot:TRINITY_DN4924_c6_g1_i1.p1 TRINITY_DN4924_c6_g1~~TRINITY_DN4924_c6_g1_i1.p1  ORF type:complete len:351 (+),score=83.48 TRINITY_DN4924_c6_g1_i1:67-1053(+)